MPSYLYTIVRRPAVPAAPPAEPEPQPESDPEPSYRGLQEAAKARGIPANQSADDLKAALEGDDE